MSKLDRFLVCDSFLDRWPDASCSILPKGTSDHCPILLSCTEVDFGPIPFKFFNSWVGSNELQDMVSRAVTASIGGHRADTRFLNMLKDLKKKIKVWRKSVNVAEEVVGETLKKWSRI